jgi:aminoglycoside 3-N-acetyltransferase
VNERAAIERIAGDLGDLGIAKGDIIMVHSSMKSLGRVPGGLETVVQGLLSAVGENGTILMPALSWMQQPHHIHNTRETPSNVGAIPEYFRQRQGTLRSVHPTHSVSGLGGAVKELFKDHPIDTTPVGPNSPFSRMIDMGARIVMLGCGLGPNTTMHGLEEHVNPPYLFGDECLYTITDWNGNTYTRIYRQHGFEGWKQRYDRVSELPDPSFIRRGKVLEAETFVLNTMALKRAALARLAEDPLFFVDKVSPVA